MRRKINKSKKVSATVREGKTKHISKAVLPIILVLGILVGVIAIFGLFQLFSGENIAGFAGFVTPGSFSGGVDSHIFGLVGTEVTSCGEISESGNYYLLDNLDCNGEELNVRVSANEVNLNCRGNVISHSAGAVSVIDASNVHIKNCFLSGGVAFLRSEDSSIQYSSMFGGSEGVDLDNSCDVEIISNHIYNNDIGIDESHISGCSFSLTSIQDNFIYNNGDGIVFSESEGNQLSNNLVFDNSVSGLELFSSNSIGLSDNKICNNGEQDIYCQQRDTSLQDIYGTSRLYYDTYDASGACTGFPIGDEGDCFSFDKPWQICGGEIIESGAYYLNSDIGPCFGDGLTISADDVELFCAGNSISGTGDVVGAAGINVNADGVIIDHCNLLDFEIGVFVEESEDFLLTDSEISGVDFGMKVIGSTIVNVLGSFISSSVTGIQVLDSDTYLFGTEICRFNAISCDGVSEITVEDSSLSLVDSSCFLTEIGIIEGCGLAALELGVFFLGLEEVDSDSDGVDFLIDCDDDDSSVGEASYYVDMDYDGYGDDSSEPLCFGADLVEDNTDCNDDYDSINPGATEICSDDKDNDCNPLTDEEDTTICSEEEDSCTFSYGDIDGSSDIDDYDLDTLLYILRAQIDGCGASGNTVCDYIDDGYYVCQNGENNYMDTSIGSEYICN